MTRAKDAASNVKYYTRRLSKAGTYGEHRVITWADDKGTAIARVYDNNDGTAEVTLYTADNKAFPKTLSNDEMLCWNVCEAHVKERGFTTAIRETADVRAYND